MSATEQATKELIEAIANIVIAHTNELTELDRAIGDADRSEEHTSELQSRQYLVCRLLLENSPPPPVIFTLSLHDALPISSPTVLRYCRATSRGIGRCTEASRHERN